ncbi:hypothetical protein [Thermosulfurimonas sp.]|uniref:hypothetical protein n=1 Tax=Thermosulfurimonas sp. TaxID=2080236 RepID=UPI0025D08BDD|nr:hypothetical protein [Thermosulfurimonas sp.]
MELEEITLKIPRSVAQGLEKRDILFFLADKALSKLEYYRSRVEIFRRKYGCELKEFQKRVLSHKEDFEKWEDLILWEGYERAYREWKRKYEDLKSVLPDH